MADFETTTDPKDTRVWGFGVVNIDDLDEIYFGNNLNDFMKLTYKLHNPNIYFHNLKFDGEFIQSWLLQNGYEYNDKARDKTFSSLISNAMQFYQIRVVFRQNKFKHRRVTFYDSLKKLPFSVDRIGKAFNLDVEKLDVPEDFYHRQRPKGHQLTPEEIAYIKNDILVVAKALKIQFDQDLNKMTIGSDALYNFKQTMGGVKMFEYNFPIFSHEIDNDIRQAYRGGMVWVNPKYQDKELGENTSYDVVSLYPSVMYNEYLPHGVPIFFEGQYKQDNDFPLFIQKVEVGFDIKPDHIPTIQIKNSGRFLATEYINSSEGDTVILYMSSIDIELMLEQYDVHYINYINGWKFRQVKGVFCDYIDHWLHLKDTSSGAIRELAKLMLNSLYGKFATNPDVTGKIPYLKNDIVHYKDQEETLRNPVYTAMGVFITSYARAITIRAGQKHYDRFIYCDTDSIHLTGLETPDLDIGTKLGQWEPEGNNKRAKFLRAKTYIKEDFNGNIELKGAGMPDTIKSQVTWENFERGFSAMGKLKPRRVKGGVVLEPTTFTIKW